MQQSLEAYFLINLTVDAALIAVVARANGCLKMRRILACAAMAASYAVLTRFLPRLAHPAVQIALLALLAIMVCDDPDVRTWGAIAFQLFCGTAMLGGIGVLSPHSNRIRILFLGGGLLILSILLSVRRQRLSTWEVTVSLTFRGKSVSFRALIDTGNRLREPVSGLPVLVAEKSLVDGLIDQDKDANGRRKVSFGALGGSGTVECFHPDLVLIRRGDHLVRAPEVWVAVYPGKIPGSSRALAPPSFAVIPGRS